MLCNIKIIRSRHENNGGKFKLFTVKVEADHREVENQSPRTLKLTTERMFFNPYFVRTLYVLLRKLTLRL